ncbi:MAG TPA: glycosyltransferase family 2 protein, partial [Oligoflexia bacterium]|nr:glycosyltransferase family 2 protein [Oligoflexia bacterium]
MSLTVLILTYNEEKHLARCLESLKAFATEVFIVDSYSTDQTLAIAQEMGAKVYQNTWVNYAVQFQWGLDHCPIRTPWVMRMDADEYVTPELAKEIKERLPKISDAVSGLIVKRQVHFMDRWIRHGGYYPTKLLRIWRTGMGSIE